MHKPDHLVSVEIRDHAYVYTGEIMAAGGLPLGTGGRAMLLLAPNGAEVNVRDDAAERLLANGFTKPKAEAKPERKEEGKPSKPRRRKAE